MKQILILIIAFVMPLISAHGASVCLKNDSYISILRKDVDGTSTKVNDTAKTWKVVFSYKTITGLAACNVISGTYGAPRTNLYTDASDEGVHCWCKMEPVADTVLNTDVTTGLASYWIYAYAASSESDCADDCASTCANWISTNHKIDGDNDGFRIKLFEAIW